MQLLPSATRLNRSFEPVAAVLAAGESRRMGRPKALVEWGRVTFLDKILRLYRGLEIPCCVVLGKDAEAIRGAVDLGASRVLVNPHPERGPLSSLQLAVNSASGSSAILLHPVDHPLVGGSVIRELIRAHRRAPASIVVPTYRGRRGHPALFPQRFYPDLLEAPLEQGARWLVLRQPQAALYLPVANRGVLANLNRPQDLRNYRYC